MMRISTAQSMAFYFWMIYLAISVKAKSSSTSSRIVGGTDANRNAYPFFTVVERDGNKNCAGSLIWPDIVLSAAHCWDEDTSTVFIAHVNFTSLSSSFSNNNNRGERVRTVERVAVHPDFEPTLGLYDIMLLKLVSPVFDIEPVVLNAVATVPKAKDRVTVVGIGLLDYEAEDQPDTLQEVTIPVVANNVCNSADAYHGSLDGAIQLCAGEEGKDACQGDSGGPLLLNDRQVGIVNFGRGCGGATHPGVYTRISAFAEWIEFVTCNITDVPCFGAPMASSLFALSVSASSKLTIGLSGLLSILVCTICTST